MEATNTNYGELIASILYLLYFVGISSLFWFKDSNVTLVRIVLSSHGVLIILTYIGAMAIGLSGSSSQALLYPFWATLILPIASIIFCIKFFTGNKWLHLLHVVSIFALFWVWFIGSMAVTNDWL